MLCRYRFELKAPLRVPKSIPVRVAEFLFEFEINREVLTAINVSVRCDDRTYWPLIEPTGVEGVVKPIVLSSPRAHDVHEIVLTFLGLLSLRGWEAHWNEKPLAQTWVAESKEEAQTLSIRRYEISRTRRHSPLDFPVPINDLVQTVLASDTGRSLRQPLEFLQYANERRGARRFIEAFQYYYFVIESLYAGGRFKRHQVVSRMMAVTSLCENMQRALASPEYFVHTPDEKATYFGFVSGLTIEEAFHKMACTRGELHHHTLRSPTKWSLNNQDKFWAVATLAADVVNPQLFWESRVHVWDQAVLDQYERIRASIN